MYSLTELHPIFAGAIPDPDPDPVQCVLHDGFADNLKEIEDAERMFGGPAGWSSKGPEVLDDLIEMVDTSLSSMRPVSNKLRGSSVALKPVSTPGQRVLQQCQHELDELLQESVQAVMTDVKTLRRMGTPFSATPDLVEDSYSSFSSSNSDIDDAPPAPLKWSKIQAKPLAVATIPNPSVETPSDLHTINPLFHFLMCHTSPLPLNPILSTSFTTKPKKRVHFHASHTTRVYHAHSFAKDFIECTFSPTRPSGYEPDLAKQRQLNRNVRKTSANRRCAHDGTVIRPRTCQAAFIAAQHSSSSTENSHHATPPPLVHESMTAFYRRIRTQLNTMQKSFTTSLFTPVTFPTPKPTLDKPVPSHDSQFPSQSLVTKYTTLSYKLFTKSRSLLREYLVLTEFITKEHAYDSRKMSSCPSTDDVSMMEEIVGVTGRRVEGLREEFGRELRGEGMEGKCECDGESGEKTSSQNSGAVKEIGPGSYDGEDGANAEREEEYDGDDEESESASQSDRV